MKLIVNQEEVQFPGESMTVRELLAAKRWSFPLIIVKINGRLVERSSYDAQKVVDGDEVEIYHLVSGG